MMQSVEIELGRNGGDWTDELWVSFARGDRTVRRPAFLDGDRGWVVRFAAPEAGDWVWLAESGEAGKVEAPGARLLKMSPGERNAKWNDGVPFFPVADTAWALPWRASQLETEEWVADRRDKGFTAALLMTVQPDKRAEGPEDRTALDGFARGFADLHRNALREIVPSYWRHLDRQILTLLESGIVPIHTPLFYGFGWKGLDVIGPTCPPEHARDFVRMLVARYGAWPCMWLVGADGTGREPAVEAMGEEVDRCDAYEQPTGLHYNPWQPSNAHWDADWCDFHLCQTGHSGDHRADRVAAMHARTPVRAVANGEPTYEAMGFGKYGLDRWQHDEAWENLCAGGTFGCFYGAGSLWQWKREGETAWGEWSAGPFDWREAMRQPGSRYPGILGRAIEAFAFDGMSPDVTRAKAMRCVSAGTEFTLVYAPQGGVVEVFSNGHPQPWRAICTLTGKELGSGRLSDESPMTWPGNRIELPAGSPAAILIGEPRP